MVLKLDQFSSLQNKKGNLVKSVANTEHRGEKSSGLSQLMLYRDLKKREMMTKKNTVLLWL